MTDLEFCTLMKKYDSEYQGIKKGPDGVYCLPVQEGDIEPFGDNQMCVYLELNSSRRKLNLIKRLPKYCTITQNAETEVCFRFPSEHLHDIANMLGARKRMKLSDELRKRKVDLINAARIKKVLMGRGGLDP